MYILQTN